MPGRRFVGFVSIGIEPNTPRLLLYDVRERMFTTPSYTACRGNIGSSMDGSRVLILNQFVEFASDDVFSLNTSTGATMPTGIHLLTAAHPKFDRNGSRMVLNRTNVYDGYMHLGNLPSTTDAVVLSPDGTRAFAYDRSGELITYDLVSAPISGVFQQIGPAIALAGDPGRSSLPGPYTESILMTISPDGGAVFIAGTDAVIVQPTP